MYFTCIILIKIHGHKGSVDFSAILNHTQMSNVLIPVGWDLRWLEIHTSPKQNLQTCRLAIETTALWIVHCNESYNQSYYHYMGYTCHIHAASQYMHKYIIHNCPQ